MNNSSLTQLKCEPCSGNTTKLSPEDIQKKLQELNDQISGISDEICKSAKSGPEFKSS